jgi:Holliday junction DNA helicase RuvA
MLQKLPPKKRNPGQCLPKKGSNPTKKNLPILLPRKAFKKGCILLLKLGKLPDMITFLEGQLYSKQPARIVMNVGGVGYEIFIPLCTYDRLPPEGDSCRVLTHHHFTDSEQRLFGFFSEEERNMFTRLLTISGIGPKLAISALSGLPVRELKTALINGDVKRISSISGIGKKTAERIIIELRDKFTKGEQLDAFAGGEGELGDARVRDAVLALGALGYKSIDAQKMIQAALPKLKEKDTVEDLIRLALTK